MCCGRAVLQGDATYLIVTNEGQIEKYGLNAVCTHLGCVVPWNKVRPDSPVLCHFPALGRAAAVVRQCGRAGGSGWVGTRPPARRLLFAVPGRRAAVAACSTRLPRCSMRCTQLLHAVHSVAVAHLPGCVCRPRTSSCAPATARSTTPRGELLRAAVMLHVAGAAGAPAAPVQGLPI